MSTVNSKHRGDIIREQREKNIAKLAETTLQAAFEAGHENLAENNYGRVRELLEQNILPATDLDPVDITLTPTATNPYSLIELLDADSPWDVDDDVLEDGFESLFVELDVRDRVTGDATDEAPVYEYLHQIGERYYSPLSAGNEPVQLVDPDGDLNMTLLVGGTGSGKSTAGKTLAEDRIAKGHKIIDLIDTQRVENGLWDCACRHEDLNEKRREAGMDVGFDEFDPPEQEILMPLSERIGDAELPYNTETDEFVVRPFTIPASELSYRQLAMMLHHTTQTREHHIQQAYDEATRRWDDYTLGDLAELIRDNPEVGDSVSDRIIGALRTLQKKSYIRDKECPHALNWIEIMQDPGVVSSFSVRTVQEAADKKAVLAFLIDSLKDARDHLDYTHQLKGTPKLTVLMREMHFVSPSSSNQSEQDSESTLEKYMIGTMQKLSAMHRHADVEVIADSQSFDQQLHKSVRDMFHRVFVFGHKTNTKEIETVFNLKIGDKTPAGSISSWKNPGKCAAITPDGFTMPIQIHPPRHHHIDAKSEGNGLAWRDRNLEHEELREPPWSGDLPARIRFDDVGDSPIERFWNMYIKKSTSDSAYVLKDDITEAYKKWAEVNDEPLRPHNHIHSYISRSFDVDDGQTTKHSGDGKKTCYWGVALTF